MCLLAWDWQPSQQQLLLIGNRDEFLARPSRPLHRWEDAPIIAGRDGLAGGTWLGLSAPEPVHGQLHGHIPVRMAALTNYRDPSLQRQNAKSRGELVSHFLRSKVSALDYVQEIASHAHLYLPFNLLVFDGLQLCGFESVRQQTHIFEAGVHAVSNACFDTPWPKLTRLKSGLSAYIAQGQTSDATLFALLADPTPAPDALLPQTGIGLERERALSSIFIATPDYGTRVSTLVRIEGSQGYIKERSFLRPKGFIDSPYFASHQNMESV